jgi:hypothetical protein
MDMLASADVVLPNRYARKDVKVFGRRMRALSGNFWEDDKKS